MYQPLVPTRGGGWPPVPMMLIGAALRSPLCVPRTPPPRPTRRPTDIYSVASHEEKHVPPPKRPANAREQCSQSILSLNSLVLYILQRVTRQPKQPVSAPRPCHARSYQR